MKQAENKNAFIVDKPQLTRRNLSQVFNFRYGHLRADHFWCYQVKLPNLKLKTQPKQLLGSLPLVTALPGSPLWVEQRCLYEDFIVINENTKRFAMGFYAKHNGGERGQDSTETERECAWETEHMRKREVASVQRSTDLHKHEKERQNDEQDKLCR